MTMPGAGAPDQRILDDLQTAADWVRWAASRFSRAKLFFGHGADNAFDEAYTLLLHVLHLRHPLPDYVLQTRLDRAERMHMLKLIETRVASRKPLAYLIKEAWFAGLSFYVDERVLVPRSPMAELIDTRFEPWSDPERVSRILDLCTGSGCIAIACAAQFPDALVDATDISTEALAVAGINKERHAMDERVRLIQADVYSGLAAARYDLIVSNPPYVDAQDMQTLPPEFHHEPALGLAAGESGLDVVRRILAGAADYLAEDGLLVVEVGNSAEAVIEAWPAVPFLWLDLAQGGHGIFLLTAAQVRDHHSAFAA